MAPPGLLRKLNPMRTEAALIARRVRRNTAYWGDAEDSLKIADQAAVQAVEDTPVGDLWKFSDGSILVNNDRYTAAVAKGDLKRRAEQYLMKEIHDQQPTRRPRAIP